jgi:hypothetical protein
VSVSEGFAIAGHFDTITLFVAEKLTHFTNGGSPRLQIFFGSVPRFINDVA